MTKGQSAYTIRRAGHSWVVVAQKLGYEGYRAADKAQNVAKRHALTRDLKWPPDSAALALKRKVKK